MMWIVWTLAALIVVLWTLLAWALHAVLGGSAEGAGALFAPLLGPLLEQVAAPDAWRSWFDSALGWSEQAVRIALWIVWGIGTALILLAAGLGSALLRLGRGALARGVAGRWRAISPDPR